MNNKTAILIVTGLIAASLLFWTAMFQNNPENGETPQTEEGITLTMYHGEGCMCCVRWADYLEEEGFEVTKEKVDNLFDVKEEHGVPYEINSCHTAIADGYVIEGHVPAEDIRRLLAERPEATGISVPGMPPNSPGMDAPVTRTYHTLLFDGENTTVFNTHE